MAPLDKLVRLWRPLRAVRDQAFAAQRYPKVVLLGVLTIALVVTVFNSRFISYGNVTNMSRSAALIGIAAVAETIVLIGGGFDLSIGAMAAFSGLVVAKLIGTGTSVPLAIAVALAFGVVLGFGNGFVISVLRINPIIATLGTSSVYYGAVLLYTQGIPVTYPTERLNFLGATIFSFPVSFVIYITVLILAGVLLHLTVFGWRLYATGANRLAAQTSGVRVTLIEVMSYILSGLLAACAGVLLAVELGSAQPTGGQGWLLVSIAAPIIGGVAVTGGAGTLFGGFLGIVLITEISNGLILAGFSSYSQQLALGLAILLAMVTQSDRLKGIGVGLRRLRATGAPGDS